MPAHVYSGLDWEGHSLKASPGAGLSSGMLQDPGPAAAGGSAAQEQCSATGTTLPQYLYLGNTLLTHPPSRAGSALQAAPSK